jgi:RNA polymerase sigma-70 factor (ECF subfamily)
MDPFCTQLTQLRAALMRTARLRLRNIDWAEDAVSETLLAALQRRPDFNVPERVRAWVFGILRHKIVDQLRLHLTEDAERPLLTSAEQDIDDIGDPCTRANPMHRLADRQFVIALHRQLASLPRAHADAFMLRECWGKETAEICDELAVTSGHLGVILHRTRHRLRQRLADHRG